MSSTSRKARKRVINYQEVESDEDIDLEDQDESGEIKSMGSVGVIKRTAGDTYGTKEATSELYESLYRVVGAVSLIDNLPPSQNVQRKNHASQRTLKKRRTKKNLCTIQSCC